MCRRCYGRPRPAAASARKEREVDHASAGKDQQRESQQPKDMTLPRLVRSMPWLDLIEFIGILVGLILAAASIGYRYGAGQWPLS